MNSTPPRQSARISLKRGVFYKYKSLREDKFDHVAEIIRDALIYCPRPTQLNDTLECRPRMIIGDITNPDYRPQAEAWARRCVLRRHPPPTEEQFQNEFSTLTQEELKKMVNEATELYHAEVNSRFRILSLADSAENPHLWAKYADNYAGVCLGFSVNSDFGTAYPVSYTNTLAAFDLTINDGWDALFWTMLVKKARWKNEREIRLVFGDPPIPGERPLENQRLRFNPLQLTSITFGHRVSKLHKETLENLILSQPYNRKFFRVISKPNGTVKLRQYFPNEFSFRKNVAS